MGRREGRKERREEGRGGGKDREEGNSNIYWMIDSFCTVKYTGILVLKVQREIKGKRAHQKKTEYEGTDDIIPSDILLWAFLLIFPFFVPFL